MTCPDPDDLPAALITHACGLTAASAANELICAHRDWLTNRDFTDGYITTGTHANGQVYAYIHWETGHHRYRRPPDRRRRIRDQHDADRRQPRRPPHPRPPRLLPGQPRPHQHPPRHRRNHPRQWPPRGLNTARTPATHRDQKAPRPQRRGLPRIPEPATRKHPATYELHAKGDFRHTRSPRRCADETPSPQVPRHFYSQRLLAQTRHRPPRTPECRQKPPFIQAASSEAGMPRQSVRSVIRQNISGTTWPSTSA